MIFGTAKTLIYTSPLLLLLLSESNFEEDFINATDLWLVGVSLNVMISLHSALIERKLRAGHTIKALFVHPEGPALEMAEMRMIHPNIKKTRGDILNNLQALCNLSRIMPGKLEIRTIQHPISHSIIAKDPETALGIIYIQSYSFKVATGSRPKFVLRRKDGYWYEWFKEELNNLWESGIDWHCGEKEE